MQVYLQKFIDSLRSKGGELAIRNNMEIGWLEILTIVAFYALFLLAYPAEPPDDLLRHMQAYVYGYDYRLLWPFSPGIPKFDPYLLFDMTVGAIHRWCGPNGYLVIQIAALLLYIVAVYRLCKDATSRNWRFTVTMAIVALSLWRITLGRPSVFESGLFLLGLATCKDEKIGWQWHFALGLFMASFYYLFFIYLIPLVIYRRTYLFCILIGLAGWLSYAGSDYLLVLRDVFTMQSMRGGLVVMEEAPLITNMFRFLWVLIPVAYYWRKDTKRLLATCWFIISNQARYLETIIPTLASFAQYWPIRMTQANLAVILISLIVYTHRGTTPDNSWKMLSGVVPAGSKVLCLESDTMYKMVYANNERIQITPCQDVAWDTAAYRTTMVDTFNKGAVNAPALKNYDYLVEKNLKVMPAGVTLSRISGKYRVWKIPKTKGDCL